MLAANAPEELQYPVYVSPKLDGIRCLIKDGVALSRSLKPIPNKFIQSVLGTEELNGFDGEITVGPPTHSNVMQTTMSAVMSQEGEPEFKFSVFDCWLEPKLPFDKRTKQDLPINSPCIDILPQALVHDKDSLLTYEKQVLAEGFEGVMIRDPKGPY